MGSESQNLPAARERRGPEFAAGAYRFANSLDTLLAYSVRPLEKRHD